MKIGGLTAALLLGGGAFYLVGSVRARRRLAAAPAAVSR
jgi:hypothetical protein